MFDRRTFLRSALFGSAAFGFGLKLGLGHDDRSRRVLHAFLPGDDEAVRAAVAAFLAAAPGRLPAPVVDITPRLRPAVGRALRERADDYERGGARLLWLQVADLPAPLPGDVLIQDGGRILDPASEFGRALLDLRERVHGRPATVAFAARLEPRRDAAGPGRVLVVETERGLHDRIPLAGAARTLTVEGPAGPSVVACGEDGARVVQPSCRHRTCQLQGVAVRPGDLIACAPNRLVLRVESA